MAARVGEDYGRQLASRMGPGEQPRSVRAAMRAIADTLTAHGFAAHAERQGDANAVVAEQCPFGDTAATHPVLCAVDRGMVKGLLAGLCGESTEESTPVILSSRARGDDNCVAVV
jgi:predicted ArsR family transcriptional regulator